MITLYVVLFNSIIKLEYSNTLFLNDNFTCDKTCQKPSIGVLYRPWLVFKKNRKAVIK